MDFRVGSKHLYARILSAFLSAGLFFSFGLHAVQVPHTHFASHETHEHQQEHVPTQTMLGEYMHLADKKLVVSMYTMTVLLVVFLDGALRAGKELLVYASVRYTALQRKALERDSFYNYLCLYFRKGIIHTKVF